MVDKVKRLYPRPVHTPRYHLAALQPSPGLQSTMALISALHGPQQCSGTMNEWVLIRQPREALLVGMLMVSSELGKRRENGVKLRRLFASVPPLLLIFD